jgi:hypothetical protein
MVLTLGADKRHRTLYILPHTSPVWKIKNMVLLGAGRKSAMVLKSGVSPRSSQMTSNRVLKKS